MLRSKVNNVLENTLIQIRKLNKPCLIAGDFNIDLLKYNIHQITPATTLKIFYYTIFFQQ